MRTAAGLERILLLERNVSDLLQLLAHEEPGPLGALIGARFDRVHREFPLGAGPGDLVLLAAGTPVAAIEVKVGHSFGEAQREMYETWARASGDPLIVLASVDSRTALPPAPWHFHPLWAVFDCWSASGSFAGDLARRVTAALRTWDELLEGLMHPEGSSLARFYSDVPHAALMRVVSRDLSARQVSRGVEAKSSLASGGGHPISQSWTRVPGTSGLWFIADARFETGRVHLRFGIDGEPGTAAQVWRVAQLLDEAITVQAFEEFLRTLPANAALPDVELAGRRRPQARGDWDAVVGSGSNSSKANPGFLRDGLTRLECGCRIPMSTLNSWGLDLLMSAVHEHLQASWARL